MRHLIFPLLYFGLSACNVGGKSEPPPAADDDDDGYLSTVDCDDADPAVHPDAEELCDDVDSDCDGQLEDAEDVSDSVRWHADADGDGYGDFYGNKYACAQPDGFVDNMDDCDDDDATVYPGAEEVCGDGGLNDCDSEIESEGDICLEEGEIALWDADATFLGEAAGDHVGLSVASAGDVDNDGLADLVVGADDVNDSGAAYLLLGGRVLSGADGERKVARADLAILGEARNDGAGHAVSSAGDINGDGQSDLLIGASGEDSGSTDAGAAYLLLDGGLLDLDLRQRDLSEADIKLLGEAAGDAAGRALASAGDIDGDDLDDLLIGAPGENTAGAAYLLLGGGALYDAMGSLSLSTAELKLVAGRTGDGVGSAVAGVGDVDGDGLADIVVGASGYGENDSGRAYILLGGGGLSHTGARSVADADLTVSSSAGDRLGESAAGAGDIDGDGRADLAIGVHNRDTGDRSSGSVLLLLSDGTLADPDDTVFASNADLELYGEREGDRAGCSVASAGDIDGDELADLLVGARSKGYSGGLTGTTYLLLGGGALRGATGTLNLGRSDHKFISEETGDAAGISVAGIGDINGDSLDDIVIGAELVTVAFDRQGAAYLFLGGSF